MDNANRVEEVMRVVGVVLGVSAVTIGVLATLIYC